MFPKKEKYIVCQMVINAKEKIGKFSQLIQFSPGYASEFRRY